LNKWYIYRNPQTNAEIRLMKPRDCWSEEECSKYEGFVLVSVIDTTIPPEIKKKVGGN
jgi:hypothetical protein